MHVWHFNSDCNLLIFNQIQNSIQDVCLSSTVPSQELPPIGRIGPRVHKNYWSSLLQNFKQTIQFPKNAYHAQLEALSPI